MAINIELNFSYRRNQVEKNLSKGAGARQRPQHSDPLQNPPQPVCSPLLYSLLLALLPVQPFSPVPVASATQLNPSHLHPASPSLLSSLAVSSTGRPLLLEVGARAAQPCPGSSVEPKKKTPTQSCKNSLPHKMPKRTKERIIWLQVTPCCAQHWLLKGKRQKMDTDLKDQEYMEVDEQVEAEEYMEVDGGVDEVMEVLEDVGEAMEVDV
nr:uncharacterized protein LOC106145931 [Columba livia]